MRERNPVAARVFLAGGRDCPTKETLMTLPRILAAVPFLALTACGGSGAQQSFLDAAPSYSALAMDEVAADSVAPASTAGALTAADPQAVMGFDAPCHPHLFIRSHEVAARVNGHLARFLRHVAFALGRHPEVATDGQHVWERTLPSGVSVRFTMTRTGDVFTWLLELAPPGGSFVQVFWGQIDRTGAAGPGQGKGTLTLDLTALHQVIPAEHGTGQVSAGFQVTGAFRHIVVDAHQVAWVVDPMMLPPGMDPAVVTALEQPRDDHYVFYRKFGAGGSLKVKDQMVFLCPANPSYKLADGVVADRWYRASDLSRHGRSDGLLTGGQLPDQLPTPWARAVGVTCQQGSTEMGMPDELFWLMKAEAGDGSTIVGWSSELLTGGASASACDPALNPPSGTVPDLAGSANDFDFSTVTFAASVDLADPANAPYPFPGL